jgi:hypothetical protein
LNPRSLDLDGVFGLYPEKLAASLCHAIRQEHTRDLGRCWSMILQCSQKQITPPECNRKATEKTLTHLNGDLYAIAESWNDPH